MNCPYCSFEFLGLITNNPSLPDSAPILCQDCGAVGVMEHMVPRKATDKEMAVLRDSSAWKNVIGPTQQLVLAQKRARTARNN